MALCRARLAFTGMVQGVGFRFTTRRVAQGREVTGWVKNLPGGSVEVVAEGSREALMSFRDAILEAMGGYIRGHTQEWLAATDEFGDFTIAF